MREKEFANVFSTWNKLHLCFSGQNSEAYVKPRIPCILNSRLLSILCAKCKIQRSPHIPFDIIYFVSFMFSIQDVAFYWYILLEPFVRSVSDKLLPISISLILFMIVRCGFVFLL